MINNNTPHLETEELPWDGQQEIAGGGGPSICLRSTNPRRYFCLVSSQPSCSVCVEEVPQIPNCSVCVEDSKLTNALS